MSTGCCLDGPASRRSFIRIMHSAVSASASRHRRHSGTRDHVGGRDRPDRPNGFTVGRNALAQRHQQDDREGSEASNLANGSRVRSQPLCSHPHHAEWILAGGQSAIAVKVLACRPFPSSHIRTWVRSK
jgi:hypothetical protein